MREEPLPLIYVSGAKTQGLNGEKMVATKCNGWCFLQMSFVMLAYRNMHGVIHESKRIYMQKYS